MEHIHNFEDFINEDINFERVSDKECYLTRTWYYYNPDDDIVYGSNEKPSSENKVVFENKQEYGIRMFTFDLNTEDESEIVGEDEVLEKINKMSGGGITLDDLDDIQDLFDNDADSRYILLDGKRMLASSFDVIEEN